MKKLLVILALAILLVPGIVMAACSWQGDPMLARGWGYLNGWSQNPYLVAGIDRLDMYPCQVLTDLLRPRNASAIYDPVICHGADTFCFEVTSKRGWVTGTSPAQGTAFIVPVGSYWAQYVTITMPTVPGIVRKDTIIARMNYTNTAGACDPTCGDCADPTTYTPDPAKPTEYISYWQADTLIITLLDVPLPIFQADTTEIDQGQAQANVPFSICHNDYCNPIGYYDYNIKSKGHIGAAINTSGSVSMESGECVDVYGVLDASAAMPCDWDTLQIIAWTTAGTLIYDTCVQLIHVIEPVPVPLFTVPVVTILVLALILAAAVFMRRRAVSRA